jgi:Tfp pilus assembly protein PilX
VVLIVALIMLLVIGLMSVSVMRGALSSDLVANNARAQGLAQQSALVALRYCEKQILPAGNTFAQNAKGTGVYWWQAFNSWYPVSGRIAKQVPNSVLLSADSAFGAGVISGKAPECLAEKIKLEDGVSDAVIVTARGFSPDYTEDSAGRATSGSVMWVQSTVRAQ